MAHLGLAIGLSSPPFWPIWPADGNDRRKAFELAFAAPQNRGVVKMRDISVMLFALWVGAPTDDSFVGGFWGASETGEPCQERRGAVSSNLVPKQRQSPVPDGDLDRCERP